MNVSPSPAQGPAVATTPGICTGVLAKMLPVPYPSCPKPFEPHDQRLPSLVRATV
jgi:hypothetical protein